MNECKPLLGGIIYAAPSAILETFNNGLVLLVLGGALHVNYIRKPY
jgi:hypothetical protein